MGISNYPKILKNTNQALFRTLKSLHFINCCYLICSDCNFSGMTEKNARVSINKALWLQLNNKHGSPGIPTFSLHWRLSRISAIHSYIRGSMLLFRQDPLGMMNWKTLLLANNTLTSHLDPQHSLHWINSVYNHFLCPTSCGNHEIHGMNSSND